MRTRVLALTAGLSVIALLLLSSSVSAQTTVAASPPSVSKTTKWEIEIYGGRSAVRTPDGGASQLPAAGPTFTYIGLPSRRVPSWYFGDGASLVNQSVANRAISARLSPLDSILSRAVMKGAGGGSAGLRISRRLTQRFSAEFNVDVSNGAPRMDQAARDQIETTRASFLTLWNQLLPSTVFRNVAITSTSDIQSGGGGRQTLATFAVSINLGEGHGIQPYVSAGGGVGVQDHGGASFTLTGRYTFSPRIGNFIVGTFDESDTVHVRYETKHAFPVGAFGGGVKIGRSRHGVRLDIRFLLSRDTSETILDATPAGVMSSPEFDLVLGDGLSPWNLVFSNNPGLFSSLSGAPIVEFTTRTRGGTIIRTLVTIGYVFRF